MLFSGMLRVVRSVLAVARVRVDLLRVVLQICVSHVGRVVLGVLVVPPPFFYIVRVGRVACCVPARVGRPAVRVERVACRVVGLCVVSCSACVSRFACCVSCCSILAEALSP